MTNEQKTRIAAMRRDGYSYSKIAADVGVNENTVKTFCRRNPVAIAPEAPAPVFPGITEKPCRCCGKTVIQYPGRKEKKFCSDACRNKWWNTHLNDVKRKAMYEFTCPACGSTFYAYGNRSRKYCSHACYINDRFGGAACE